MAEQGRSVSNTRRRPPPHHLPPPPPVPALDHALQQQSLFADAVKRNNPDPNNPPVTQHQLLNEEQLRVYMRNLKSELNFANDRVSRTSLHIISEHNLDASSTEQQRDLEAAQKINAETMRELEEMEDLYEGENSIVLSSLNRILAQLNYPHALKSIGELVDRKDDILSTMKKDLQVEIMQSKLLTAPPKPPSTANDDEEGGTSNDDDEEDEDEKDDDVSLFNQNMFLSHHHCCQLSKHSVFCFHTHRQLFKPSRASAPTLPATKSCARLPSKFRATISPRSPYRRVKTTTSALHLRHRARCRKSAR